MFQAKAKRRQHSDSKILRTRVRHQRHQSRSLRLESLEPRHLLTGTWSAVAHVAPSNNIRTMELLSDGTVIASSSTSGAGSSTNWYKLTPDATGSYANGAWSQVASENLQRLYFATNVLQDGRVFMLGGEFSGPNGALNWNNTGEIYNPVTNIWSGIPNFPEATFGGPTMLLADGRVLAGSMTGPNTYIYDPAANAWSNGPTKLFNDSSQFETWTKLPDGSVLSYDIGAGSTEAQRLDPSTMSWIDSGTVPVALQSTRPSIGPAVLLPDGRLFQVGGNSNTALYDPSTGTWAAGPVIPGGLGANHAPAVMLPNGHVLFEASATPAYGGPTNFFEFDPTTNSLTNVAQPTDLSGWPSYDTRMLLLPSGQALFTWGQSQLYVYTPDGGPQAAWQPTISSVVANGNHYTLTGTQLNGLSAGTSYGSPAEMDSNYPIVELNNGAGRIYFATTSNWSNTGVATGSTPVTTDFALPANMPYGNYSLTVIANGIASAPVSFTGGYTNEADLAVTNTGPATSTEGSNVTYSITVTNNGPTAATNVVLTDTLDPNLTYVSATKSQGSVTHSGSVVTFSFGTVAVGQTVTATVTAQATEDGNLTNTASVTSSLPDANPYNNTASATTAVGEPAIVVSAPKTVTGKNQSNVTVATFTHASGVEPASAFVATINWGDNSTSTGTVSLSGTTYTVKGSHTYSRNGSYTVTTTVVESAGSGNFAMRASASIATTPTASISTSAINSANVTASATANATGSGGTASVASTVPSSAKVNGAGAQIVTDLDSLDALFELLSNSDPLQAGRGKGLVS